MIGAGVGELRIFVAIWMIFVESLLEDRLWVVQSVYGCVESSGAIGGMLLHDEMRKVKNVGLLVQRKVWLRCNGSCRGC